MTRRPKVWESRGETERGTIMTKGRNDPELWSALLGLHDDLLDPAVPEEMIDAELKSLGIDPRDAELHPRTSRLRRPPASQRRARVWELSGEEN